MMPASEPVHPESPDEAARLARLRRLAVMDTGSEPIFESLVRLASAICGTPIALVTLIDSERQWFKANVGLVGMSQTSRDIAFCTHAIQDSTLMEVPDVRADARFVNNPLVNSAPHIRFYAGVPLVLPEGERVGTLCVLDRQEKLLTDAQRLALTELAGAVTQALLLRERACYPAVSSEEGRFRLICEASPLGVFECDAAGFSTYTNAKFGDIYGLTLEERVGQAWRDVIHPEDRDIFTQTLKDTVAKGASFSLEHRLLRRDGCVVHVHSRAQGIAWGEPLQQGFVGTVEDITERWRAKVQLLAANSFLDRAERISGVGGWEFDLLEKTVQWTQQTRRIYELPADHLPRIDDHMRHFSAESQASMRQVTNEALRFQTPWDLVLPMITASGRAIWTRTVGVVEFENGLPRRMVGTLQDITDQKAADDALASATAALRESEERQQRALRASRLALWDMNLLTGTVYLSGTWSQLMGVKSLHDPEREDVEPAVRRFDELVQQVPAEDRHLVVQASRAITSGATDSYRVEHRINTPSGGQIWVHSEGRVTQRDAQGAAVRVTGTNRDITPRKVAEAQLAAAAAITRATLEGTTDGILVVNGRRDVELYNRQFLQIMGIPDAAAFAGGRALVAATNQRFSNPEVFLQKVEALYGTNIAESFDLMTLVDGRIVELHSRPHALIGRTRGRVWSVRDVTARQHADAELKRSRLAAEAANEAKSAFLATMSHEIRTPLNGIVGVTALLMDEPLTAQQTVLAGLIDSSAQTLLALVNDFLDLAKIDSGQLALESIRFDLHALVASLNALFAVRASAKGLVFHGDIAPDVPQWIFGDPARLRQIVSNLLGNALKFTHRGHFSLRVTSNRSPSGSMTLQLAVADTGIGMSPEVQSRLFANFVQADSSTTREYGGTGLGLAIVKRLTEAMGGQITLDSSAGHGARFTVMIPNVQDAAAPDTAPAPLEPGGATAGLQAGRILLVEDNPTNQIVALGLLKALGHADVSLVANGQEAMDASISNDYALILMDCQMPVMDGYTATQALRRAGCLTPIVAMTANALRGEAARCLDAGMNDYLAKPFNKAQLAALLVRWLPPPANTALPMADAATTPDVASIFDHALALDRLGGDNALLGEVVKSFVSRIPEMAGALAAALQARDVALAGRHAHSLVGAAGAVGATAVLASASQVSDWLRQGDFAQAELALPALQRHLAAFAGVGTRVYQAA